jgi:hypothetical protein
MRNSKLRLNVDELSVESFSPADQVDTRGTVHGADASVDLASGCMDCVSYQQPASCAWTQCQNISCVNAAGCSGGDTYGEYTCQVRCNLTPPIE